MAPNELVADKVSGYFTPKLVKLATRRRSQSAALFRLLLRSTERAKKEVVKELEVALLENEQRTLERNCARVAFLQ